MPRQKKKDENEALISQKSLLDLILEEQTKKDDKIITSMLAVKPPEDAWRGLIAIPPGTLLETVVSEFDAKSEIPLEIPFFTVVHYTAAYLLHEEVSIKVSENVNPIRPDIWSVILAKSGAGKTFVTKLLKLGIPDFKEFYVDISGITSTAKFVAILSENNNKLFFREEFTELYQQIKNNSGPLADLRDKFLQLYNNDNVSRESKKESIIVPNAAIVFLAITVKESLNKELTAEDLINGFAQRFSFIIAKNDPNKSHIDYPMWEIDTKSWEDKWLEIKKTIKHKQYIASANAYQAFKTTYRMLSYVDLDSSFYRRQLFKAHKYALIYHIMLGRGAKKTIQPDCYGWAARVVCLHNADMVELLKDHGLSELQAKLEKIDRLKQRLEAKGTTITPRIIVQNINSIKNVAEAKGLFNLVTNRI